MADDKKKKPNVFQKIARLAQEVVDWIEETFSDPELARQVTEDLGQNAANPATPAATDPAVRQKIDTFLAKEKVDEIAFLQTVAEIKALVDTGMVFADAIKNDGVSAWDVFWLIFKVWVADSLRVRNPSAYALCVLAGMVLEDDEAIATLDPAPVTRLLKGESTEADGDALVARFSAAVGGIVVALDQKVAKIGGAIDATYGWDPEPGSDPNAAVVASRMLSVVFKLDGPLDPMVTVVLVTKEHGGPGMLISVGAQLKITHETDTATYTFDLGAAGAFSLFFRFSTSDPAFRAIGPGTPSIDIGMTPKDPDHPFLVLGTDDATRLELGAFGYGVELGADHAGFRASLRKGKLVISLGDGDGFLSKLPGGQVEVPFDLGLIVDTAHGVRFDGGTGLKIDLPVAGSLFGVFTVQFLALELKLADDPSIEVRGGFAIKLGPFQASVDQIGTIIDLASIGKSGGDISDLVKFAPPKGIGLALEVGPIKGGGYLFIDAEKGEYAGALELKFLVFSVKAIALISTKRPDGSDGWSLLLFVFGQFHVHIAFGIFWTGLGGMIGLHHRADLDALTAGMRTGALDDVLFPEDPVADAPRIINRYKQLFPIEPDSLLVGPMLELSFSEPPIVYVRLGLIFEIRNALGGDQPATLTKIILLGQLLVQLPPRDTHVPAIVHLLVDVVGFYDTAEQFLMIRARLRDSYIGIEKVAKLDLSGEMVLAMRFGDDPSFVLSVGGFHPAFHDVPRGVPTDLERLAVSFGIGIVKMRSETYFAITSNSVQAGLKIEISADIDVASIKGHLAFDALLYFAPRFYFIVSVDFAVALEAFGENLMAVHVNMSLEGPGEWHAKGTFSFSILWWDVDLGFDERWGSSPEVDAGTTKAADVLLAELKDPARLLPGAPVGGSALVSLAPAGKADPALAHPLSLVSLSQKAVPLDVTIDRLGTKRLDEGSISFSITDVSVGGVATTAKEPLQEHFARGQFMDLSEQQKLEGRSFELFDSGVSIGTTAYAVPSSGTTVVADYEVAILEPEPSLNLFWVVRERFLEPLSAEHADALVPFGAAAGSARAKAAALVVDSGRAKLTEPPLAVVATDSLRETATVLSGPRTSEAGASEMAVLSRGMVVEAFEVAR